MLASADLIPRCVGEKKTPTDVVEVGEFFAGGNYSNYVQERSIHDSPIAEGDPSPLLLPESGYNFGAPPKKPAYLSRRIRPAQGGFSCSRYRSVITGTIGTCCYDFDPFPKIPKRYYLLSSNHILTSLDNALIGDPILQPALADGGIYPRDMIARLTRYVPIEYSTAFRKPLNYVDAAIAEGNLQNLDREIYWASHVKDLYTSPRVGDIVQKCGRTTGFTTGKIRTINTTLDLNWSGRRARFARQILATAMSGPGDSGSLVLNRDEHAIGLISGGSRRATIINNIFYVQQLLNIRVHEK